MARIRNQAAYQAWLARNQMPDTQQQNVNAYTQGGVPGALIQQQVPQSQFTVGFQQTVQKSEQEKNRNFGVYNYLFDGESPLGGRSGKEQSAIKILNIGHKEDGEEGW